MNYFVGLLSRGIVWAVLAACVFLFGLVLHFFFFYLFLSLTCLVFLRLVKRMPRLASGIYRVSHIFLFCTEASREMYTAVCPADRPHRAMTVCSSRSRAAELCQRFPRITPVPKVLIV